MTIENPSFLERGERARLFPVLADTSKEGRTLSIFLACIENISEFGRALLADVEVRVGVRARIETYTEVVFKKCGSRPCRPDGLIIVRNGAKIWSAIVEAKVGTNDLTSEQVEDYLELAKLNGIDAVITISNQFAAIPNHHPIPISSISRRKAHLFHWSWMYALTEAEVLLGNDDIADQDQRTILKEMVRFLTHPSAGVRSFDQMPAAWPSLVGTVQAGGSVSANSPETRDVIGAWHQKVRDLSLSLSRQLTIEVSTRIARAHVAEPAARVKADSAELAKEKRLSVALLIPDAASPLDVSADLQKRTINVSMRLKAPLDKKSTKARLNWLLRQLQKATIPDLHIRLFWLGRAGTTQHSLSSLRNGLELAIADRPDLTVQSFEIILVRDLGAKFKQPRNFVSEINRAVPEFYEAVGQHLVAWQAPAPRLHEDRADIETVSPQAIHARAEGELAQEDL